MGLLDHDVVIVRQKPKIVEMTNQYALQDEEGRDIGAVEQVGQNVVRKALRLLTSVDQYLTHRLEVRDADGQVVLGLLRPAKFLKSTVQISDGAGQPLGSIVQRNVVGKKRFSLEAPDGSPLGELLGENWISWDFRIVDAAGTEVATVNKQWAGFLREGFTTADTYVFRATPALTGALRPLAFAAAVAIDTALKQDDN